MFVGKIKLLGQADTITLKYAAGTQVGDAVTLTANATVGRGADGDPFYGKVLVVEADGLCTVIRESNVDLAYAGSLTAGYRQLGVNGAGKIKTVTSGGVMKWVDAVDATTTTASVNLGS